MKNPPVELPASGTPRLFSVSPDRRVPLFPDEEDDDEHGENARQAREPEKLTVRAVVHLQADKGDGRADNRAHSVHRAVKAESAAKP